MHRNKIALKSFLIFILLLSSLSAIPIVLASTVITQNPSSNYGDRNWFNKPAAYTNDEDYAVCSRTAAYGYWGTYGFDALLNSSCTIEKVEVGVDHYESISTQGILVAVSWDGGSSFSDEARLSSTSPVLEWIDATGLTDWTYEKLTDANLEVRARYTTAGGCYANDTFLVVYNDKSEEYLLESAGEIALGDSILVWNELKGVHVSEVSNITIHYGDWVMMDFFSGNVTFDSLSASVVWDKHLTLTSNHPMFDLAANTDKVANEFEVGDIFAHLNGSELIGLPVNKINTWNFTGFVYNIGVAEKDTCVFAKSLSKSELAYLSRNIKDWKRIGAFDSIMMAIKVPWSTYLDWLPVRVTYSVGEAEYAITFYFYDGGYLLVNGSAVANESSSDYTANTILNFTGVKNKTGWSLFWKHKNFTCNSNSTSNPYYYNVTGVDSIHTYFQPNSPANLAAGALLLLVGVPSITIIIFMVRRKKSSG